MIFKVIAIGIAAPLLSVPAGWLVYRILSGPLGRLIARRFINGAQYVGYLLQCLAYAANDAQKMVAIIAIGTSARLDPVAATVPGQLAIAGLFGAGILLTVRTMAAGVGEGVMYIRTPHYIATAIGSSCVVLATSALGVPVSTTQAATGAAVAAASRRLLSASGGIKYHGSWWRGSSPCRCRSVSEPRSPRRGG